MKHPLWPDAPDQLNAADGVDVHRYLVVPSAEDPRLVVPTRPRTAADEIVRALRDASSPRRRMQSAFLRLATRANVRTMELPDPPLFAVIASALDAAASAPGPLGEGGPGSVRDRYVFGVHVGPPRANRKPVLAVTDSSGRLLAFAKCGIDPLTDALVIHETEALSHVKDLSVTRVPELIASGDHGGHPYVLQTPVPTGPRRRDADVVAAAQVEVAFSGGPRVNPAAELTVTEERWAERASGSNDESVKSFADIAAGWCEQIREATVPWGSWHGDWRNTNMAVTDLGCSVWDWERYATGVPVGYDALHLFLTTRASSVHDLTTLPIDLSDHAARLLRPFGLVDRRDVELVTTGYLLELAGRYLDDDQARSGARLGAVGQWLLPHLQSTATSAKRTTRGVTDN